MQLYEWLLDYQELSNGIKYLDYKLDRSKRELKRWVEGDLQGVRLNEKSIASNLEERIADYEHELAHKINDLFKAKKLISTFKGLENQILYYRYIECMKLDDIAEKLDYSYSHIRKRHAELVRTVKFSEMYHKSSLTR